MFIPTSHWYTYLHDIGSEILSVLQTATAAHTRIVTFVYY
jgi:hypothetical protein